MSRKVVLPVEYNKLGQKSQARPGILVRQRFLSADNERTRVRQLEQQVQDLSQATANTRAQETPRVVEVAFSVASTPQDVYMHNFGRPAKWNVVEWRPTNPGGTANIASVEHPNEANLLRLRNGTATGIAKIEVF